MNPLDVAVVGAGPAGLTAALILGRASLDTLLLDAGSPRNAPTRHSHGFLSRDGIDPAELRSIGRDQLGTYPSVRILDARVSAARRVEDGFELTHDQGTVRARRLVVATGFRDDLEPLGIPGLREAYGTSLFPCPFCDGFEHRALRLAVLTPGLDDHWIRHYLQMIRTLSSPDLVLYTHGRALDEPLRGELAARGVPVVEQPILRVESRGGMLEGVRTADQVLHPHRAGFLGGPYPTPASDLLDQLGVPRDEHPMGFVVPRTEPDGATEIPGLYAVGDARTGGGSLMTAAAQGWTCAARIVHAVAQERWSG